MDDRAAWRDSALKILVWSATGAGAYADGFHADAKPTWLSNNWSESGGTQSFDIKPTTPYIYIAFGNSDKKPVTWSSIKFVKRG